MKKTIIILLSIVLALVLLICGMLAYSYIRDTSVPKWDEQYNLGIRYLRDGQYQEAVLAFTAAIDIAPKKYEAYIARGDAYIGLGDFQAAQQDYQQAVVIEPDCQQEVAPKLDQVQIVADSQSQITIPEQQTVADEPIQMEAEPIQTETEPTTSVVEQEKRVTRITSYGSGVAAVEAEFQYSPDGTLQQYIENTDDGFGHEFQIIHRYLYDEAGNLVREDYSGIYPGYNEYFYTDGVLSSYSSTTTGGDGVDTPITVMLHLERDAAGNVVQFYSEGGYTARKETYSCDNQGRRIAEIGHSFNDSGFDYSYSATYDYSFNGFIVYSYENSTLGQTGKVLIPYGELEYDLFSGYSLDGVCSFELDSERYLTAVRDSKGQLIYTFEYEDFSEASAAENELGPTDYSVVYSDILVRLADLLERGPEAHGVTEGENGAAEVRRFSSPEEASRQLGYAIQDISGDGIPELIIVAIDQQAMMGDYGSNILAVYTCSNGIPSLTFEGWSRNSYCLLPDGRILNQGSSGAMYSCLSINSLSRDGTELICQDFYFSDEKEPGIAGYYHNTDGIWEKNHIGNDTLTKDAYYQILSSYWELTPQLIQVTPFSFFVNPT